MQFPVVDGVYADTCGRGEDCYIPVEHSKSTCGNIHSTYRECLCIEQTFLVAYFYGRRLSSGCEQVLSLSINRPCLSV